MYRLLIFLSLVILISCKRKEKQHDLSLQRTKIERVFSSIEKEKAFLINYQFNKLELSDGIVVFKYYDNDSNNFVVSCDTSKKKYNGIFNKVDTVVFALEDEKIYSVNGKNFKLLKLIRNKGITDGEISYFFSTDVGLLVSKSNTWRIGQVMVPNKDDSDYVRLTALMYRVLTDEEMFNNPIPQSKNKFTDPKVE
ncbi:hypothetical protein [Sediminibacterium sp. C3]|uniref:hypothetical protein n=1 Tax=Sediminibacterium sp. C3 TaxID=1267211 RepID=UPI00042550C2|nr:hypothetical protein [Sediminibacterium sp. C3]